MTSCPDVELRMTGLEVTSLRLCYKMNAGDGMGFSLVMESEMWSSERTHEMLGRSQVTHDLEQYGLGIV